MNDYRAFWEVPHFWELVAVLLLLAAVMAFVISAGPGEIPFDNPADVDSEDQP